MVKMPLCKFFASIKFASVDSRIYNISCRKLNTIKAIYNWNWQLKFYQIYMQK